jgi:cell division protein FtsB
LRQIDQARGDLYGIADDIEFLKAQIAQLPSGDYVSRLALMATSALGKLIGAVALMVTQ